MNSLQAPPFLKAGQTVAVLSTARKLRPEDISSSFLVLEDWGLKVKPGRHLYAESGQFAGTDEQRLEDLQEALDDPGISAIICARGGYGTSRILDKLDFRRFQLCPKWIAGFSDVTALHTHVHSLGIQSLHSTMPICFDTDASHTLGSLRSTLFGETLSYKAAPHPKNRPGIAQGTLVGGNLSILASVIGTISDIETRDKILFIEDTDEYLYHIDRMLVHLKRACKLSGLAGLIVGSFTQIHDNGVPFGKNPYEIITEAVQEFSYPVCFDFPVGHTPDNMALLCGRQVKLEVSAQQTRMWYL
jgi:muramoyltetrapeptide carboxypeptidase